jgi:uncharacterized membrane protein
MSANPEPVAGSYLDQGESETVCLQNRWRWTAIPGIMSGLLILLWAYNLFYIPIQWPAFKESLILSVHFLTLIWLIGIYGVQKDEIKMLGQIGMTICSVAFCLMGISSYRTFVMKMPPDLTWWFAVALFLMVGGILFFGTLTLKAGRFPRPVTLCWMIGFALLCSVRGSRWMGTFILIGVGMILSSGYIWFNKLRTSKQAVTSRSTPEKAARFEALDLLRGLIMILMPIDHANGMLRGSHPFELWNNPLPLYSDAAEFVTRFITHFCAPGFFFLMGAGMILFAQSRRRLGWTQGRIMVQLSLRGLLFILLEKILWDTMLYGSIQFTKFGVMYGLGTAMIFGSLFLRMNRISLLAIGIAGLIVTQIVPPLFIKLGIYYTPLSYLLLVPQSVGKWFMIYPTIPWLSITLLGMVVGKDLLIEKEKAYLRALWAGVIFLILFVIVRIIGGFGNFQPSEGSGWIEFLNVIKYPPSLVFTLLTLGVDIIVLYFFAKAHPFIPKWARPLLLFGKTALYFYFAHWLFLGALGFTFWYFSWKSLPLMYMGWAFVLLLLIPICRWYLDFKQKTALNSVWRFI